MSESNNKYTPLELTDKDHNNKEDKMEILDSTVNTLNTIEDSPTLFYNSDLESKNPSNQKLEISSSTNSVNPYQVDLLNTKLYNREYEAKNNLYIGSCFAYLYRKGNPLLTLGPHCN